MPLLTDLKTLYHVALAPIKGQTHAERLESFYQGQAEGYDAFRQGLLHGRAELYQQLTVPEDGIWVEMGGGTGANLEYLGDRIHHLKKVYVVDLTPSFLALVQRRIDAHGWTNVVPVEADATTFMPSEPADVVTFSYSLTMIPDWFHAIDHALEILKPGGTIGVVDFYVSRKYPADGHLRHGWFTRTFWPAWFGMDNVYPSPDHVPYLHKRFEVQRFDEGRGRMKYLFGMSVPYYSFVGTKPASCNAVA